MKICLATIGCKLNQAESNKLKENLQKAGFFVVSWEKSPNLALINACSVTRGAEQITRQIIRKIKRKNSKIKIIATGCLQKKIPEIDKFIKNKEKVFNYIIKNYKKQTKFVSSKLIPHHFSERTRAFIKIQDGCSFKCSYCLTRILRGPAKSISPKEIVKEIKEKEREGYKEVVLVGVNIGLYQSSGFNLVDLLKKIFKETKIPRLRLSSLDPRLIKDDLIKLFKNPRLCPHLHLSLQSGSDKILKMMNRHYKSRYILSIIKKAKKINPLISFSADIIVGLPGETEKDFQATLNLIKKIKFMKIHFFPFSPRPKTEALKFKNKIPEKIIKKRIQLLKILNEQLKNKFIEKMFGKILPVLFEHKRRTYWEGYTSNYLRVKFKNQENLWNQIRKIKITKKNVI